MAAALQVHNLRKAYKDVVAVDGLELEVRRGECFGLLGPNGAGKTTTIEICEGLTAADSGEVEMLGMRWDSGRRRSCASGSAFSCRKRSSPKSSRCSRPSGCSAASTTHGPGAGRSDRAGAAGRESATRAWAAFPAGRSSGWRWRARWWAIPIFCSSTSPPPASIRRRAASFGI